MRYGNGDTTLAIIGGGFSAAALVLAIARREPSLLARTTVVSAAGTLGRGVAYACDPRALLNTPAGRMSVDADDPLDFVKYAATSGVAADPGAFLSRALFGDYVEAVLARTFGRPGVFAPRVACTRAAHMSRDAKGSFRITLADGDSLRARTVVLAPGHAAPRVPFGLDADALTHSSNFVANPWNEASLTAIPTRARVLVLGTGLTAVDVVTTLLASGHRGPTLAVSRRGLVPREHAPHGHPRGTPRPPTANAAGPIVPVDATPTPAGLVRAVRRACEDAVRDGRPWQGVFDDVRREAPAIWSALDVRARRRLLRHVRPYWDVHRHRVPAESAATLEAAVTTGQLAFRAARVVSLVPRADGTFAARLRGRGERVETVAEFDVVVNATGPNADLAQAGDPLIAELLSGGLLTQDPLRLGLLVDEEARALDRAGRSVDGLHVIGPARRAAVWEATGVAEILSQARDLAAHFTTEASPRRIAAIAIDNRPGSG